MCGASCLANLWKSYLYIYNVSMRWLVPREFVLHDTRDAHVWNHSFKYTHRPITWLLILHNPLQSLFSLGISIHFFFEMWFVVWIWKVRTDTSPSVIFTFMLPCFVIDNQPDALIIPILFCCKTVHISGIFSAHYQEFSTVHSALVSFMQVSDDRSQAESGWN